MKQATWSKAVVAVGLIGVVVLLATQGAAHFRQPNTFRKLKHDLRHLESNGYFSDFLFENTFVEGAVRHISDFDSRVVDGTEELADLPGFGRVVLGRDVAGTTDCYVNFRNLSGERLLRNGIIKQANGTLLAVPVSSHPEFANNSSFDAAVSNTLERGSFGTYHVTSPTNIGHFHFTASVTYDGDGACFGSVEGTYDGLGS